MGSNILSNCIFYFTLFFEFALTDEFCILFHELFNQLARMTYLFDCLIDLWKSFKKIKFRISDLPIYTIIISYPVNIK